MRGGGLLTVLFLGSMLLRLWRKERRAPVGELAGDPNELASIL